MKIVKNPLVAALRICCVSIWDDWLNKLEKLLTNK